jgi:hypothetical protein
MFYKYLLFYIKEFSEVVYLFKTFETVFSPQTWQPKAHNRDCEFQNMFRVAWIPAKQKRNEISIANITVTKLTTGFQLFYCKDSGMLHCW